MPDPSVSANRDASGQHTPQHAAGHRQLNVFVGTWRSEGRTAEQDGEPPELMVHHHTYEWLPGGFFLFHGWDGHVGDRESKGVEIIGHDPESRAYVAHVFDSDGLARVYEGSVNGRVWSLAGASERCTITFEEDGDTMTTRWDQSSDGVTWQPLCDLRARRVT